MDDGNPRSNKHTGLQMSSPATKAQIIARITALEMYYPKSPMTDGERKVWFAQWCDDLKHKTDSEIAYACTRYRQNSENRFFPTPGQLIALCQPAFDQKPRRYQPLGDLPPPRPQHEVEAMLKRARAYYPGVFLATKHPRQEGE